jgi:ubiquinone biosynthesis monooxygenase Coq7
MSTKPGDISQKERIERMIRVNHAGEFGAKRIYEGQLQVLKNSPSYETIKHMKDQELEHLDYFEKEIVKRKVRPTALHPIWNIAGFALGAGTALLGEKAAMACTVAVEEVIDEHYQQQLEELKDNEEEKDLSKAINKFREEELEHRDIGLENHAEQAPAYELLSSVIKTGSKAAIWLAQRF